MVVVIGGTGLVGTHLLCRLVQSEASIKATYTRPPKLEQAAKILQFYHPQDFETYWQKIEWHQVDVNDLFALDQLIGEGDIVYHCAALVSFHRKDFYKLMKINREGTANVVNTCLDKKVKALGYVSSTAAIGGDDSSIITEETKWKKTPSTSGYSISKYSAEKEVMRGIEEGLNIALVNPCVILGPGNWNESSLTIFKQVDKGLKFYPPGANATVDARDVAEALQKVVEQEKWGQRYLLIGSNQYFKTLFTEVATQMGKKPPSIKAGKFLLKLAYVLMSVANGVVGQRSPMTRNTLQSALGTKKYSAQKAESELSIKFIGLQESVAHALQGRIQ